MNDMCCKLQHWTWTAPHSFRTVRKAWRLENITVYVSLSKYASKGLCARQHLLLLGVCVIKIFKHGRVYLTKGDYANVLAKKVAKTCVAYRKPTGLGHPNRYFRGQSDTSDYQNSDEAVVHMMKRIVSLQSRNTATTLIPGECHPRRRHGGTGRFQRTKHSNCRHFLRHCRLQQQHLAI